MRSTELKCDDPNFIFRKKFEAYDKARYDKHGNFRKSFDREFMNILQDFNDGVLSTTWTDIENSGYYLRKWIDRSHNRVLGLTARGRELQKYTQHWLQNNNILFDKTYGWDVYKSRMPNGRDCHSHNRRILYCGGNHKGHIMTKYYGKLFTNSPHIVMIDDSMTGLKQVKQVLSEDVTFVGLHYVP